MKERLVGAAVLVAIVVWLAPWVLDGPDAPLDAGGSSLQLPVAEEPVPMRTQTLRLGEADEDTLRPPEPAEYVAATPPAIDATPPQQQPPAASEAAQAQPPPPAAESPSPAVSRVPAAGAASPVPPSSGAATTDKKGAWVVQLGSFGDENNARRLAERVNTFGYRAAVSSTRSNGRTLYRVRVGPMAVRGEADATASALGAHGLQARVAAAD